MHEVCRRPGQAALPATARHAPHEDAAVGVAPHHADAVAEYGATADRAGWVNSDHGDLTAAGAHFANQGRDERTLASAWRPRDADDVGVTGAGIQRLQRSLATGVFVFDQGRQAGQRSRIALQPRQDLACFYHASGTGA